MNGLYAIGEMEIGPTANTSITTIPNQGTIDATKVPVDRRVVFEGSKRVVYFEGSIRTVRF